MYYEGFFALGLVVSGSKYATLFLFIKNGRDKNWPFFGYFENQSDNIII